VVPEPSDEDARAAAALARSVCARGGDLGALLATAGLLDPTLPWVVRVEAAREAGYGAGRGACAAALASYGPEPLLVAAVLAGAGEAAAETGMAYAGQRVVFGRPLARMPVQRYAFASVAAAVESAAALVRRVAAARDRSGAAALDERAVLPYALDTAWAAAEAALQVHGGYGYSDEYPISVLWTEVAAARAAYVTR
jgi:alkylation response protein AidB-like acyl-CoA dehydrogenase